MYAIGFLSRMLKAAATSDVEKAACVQWRVQQISEGDMPSKEDFSFVAEVMGGSIRVVPLQFTDCEAPHNYGYGRIAMVVGWLESTSACGKKARHFVLRADCPTWRTSCAPRAQQANSTTDVFLAMSHMIFC